LLVDARGVPLSLVVTGAHRHDMKALGAVLQRVVLERSSRTKEHLCADKGYDFAVTRQQMKSAGYKPHVKARGQEQKELARSARKKARRWVVEASHSWFNRFRKLLVRFERKLDNHLALLHLAAAAIAFRHAVPCTRRDGMLLA
jgi:IS5 family transposase